LFTQAPGNSAKPTPGGRAENITASRHETHLDLYARIDKTTPNTY